MMERFVEINRLGECLAWRRQRGATLFEMLLMAPLVFCLVYLALDLGGVLWVTISMQSALQAAADYAAVQPAKTAVRAPALLAAVRNHAPSVYDRGNPHYTITLNGIAHNYSDTKAYRPEMFGKPGDQVELELDVSWPLLTPIVRPFFADGLYRFSVFTHWRNP